MNKIVTKALYSLYCTLGRWYLWPILLLEWKTSSHKRINERAIEYGFALRWLSKICPVEVLDVGSGGASWPHIMANCGLQVTAIDKIKEYWKGGFLNRHYYIINDDIYKLPDAGYGQDYPFICQVLSRKQINEWLSENPGKIIDQEYYEVFNGALWAFGERVCPSNKVEKQQRCHLTCVIIQKS